MFSSVPPITFAQRISAHGMRAPRCRPELKPPLRPKLTAPPRQVPAGGGNEGSSIEVASDAKKSLFNRRFRNVLKKKADPGKHEGVLAGFYIFTAIPNVPRARSPNKTHIAGSER